AAKGAAGRPCAATAGGRPMTSPQSTISKRGNVMFTSMRGTYRQPDQRIVPQDRTWASFGHVPSNRAAQHPGPVIGSVLDEVSGRSRTERTSHARSPDALPCTSTASPRARTTRPLPVPPAVLSRQRLFLGLPGLDHLALLTSLSNEVTGGM